jgi:DNA-binding response OmpR family regulator
MSHPPKPRIVIIEDDADLAFVLERNLTAEGFVASVARDGETGMTTVLREAPAVVVLDLMLPRRDGFAVLRAIRNAGADVPVLVLTARRQERDKLEGFRLGADDYLTKPFSMAEFIARTNALLRRVRPSASSRGVSERLRVGQLEIDVTAYTVRCRGRDVALTPKAFDLLVALMRRPGEVVSREELFRSVWGYAGDVSSRTLDTHIGDLRRQLERDPAAPQLIRTVWRVGYRLTAD